MKPEVSETWRADELYIKVKGDLKYLFAMMDDETRFWIAQEVAGGKETYDARRLFSKAREIAGKKPMTMLTDGLHSYEEAYRKEFWTQKNPRTEHIRHIRFAGDHDNNKMERLNGEIGDREKVCGPEDTRYAHSFQLSDIPQLLKTPRRTSRQDTGRGLRNQGGRRE